VVVTGFIALISNRSGPDFQGGRGRPAASGALGIDPDHIVQIRVQRDYWNTFTLARDDRGQWQLTEPANEEVSTTAVNGLIQVLTQFPIVSTIDLPADDTERFHEYGLWEPAVEIIITTIDKSRLLQVGGETTDGKGVYCVLEDRDGVMVTTHQTAQILKRDLAAYRQEARATTAAGRQMSTRGQVQIQDLQVGQGSPARAGQRLTVHYTGQLADGTEFDSSRKRGAPFTFTLGGGEVIQGWEQGIAGMRVGGRRQLNIPPELAYGSQGKPPMIPPGAPLTFDIELLSAENPSAGWQ
jgi:FKBP-type peptidyl-prolyl cis-trans isomerase